MAHAETHLDRYFASPRSHILLAVAHVAIINDFASTTLSQIYALNGCDDKSTLSTVFVSILVPELIDCCLI
jgi:hypothetical protein